MSNTIKAVIYTLVGFVASVSCGIFIIWMYLSGTFLPVYVEGNFILGNRIFRLFLYALVFAILVQCIKLTLYGYNFLIKKIRRKLKRR